MKKIVLSLSAMLVLALSSFALDFKVDADFIMPFANYSSKSTSDLGLLGSMQSEQTVKINGYGVNVGANIFLTRSLGVGGFMNFSWPAKENIVYNTTTYNKAGTQTASSSNEYTNKLNGTNGNDSLYPGYDISSFQYDLFLGLSFRPVKIGGLFLILTPGLDYQVFTEKVSYEGTLQEVKYITWGPGIDGQVGFKINKRIALNGGLYLGWNFPSKTYYNNEEVSSDDNTKGRFIIIPKVGLSFVL